MAWLVAYACHPHTESTAEGRGRSGRQQTLRRDTQTCMEKWMPRDTVHKLWLESWFLKFYQEKQMATLEWQ